MPSRYLHKGYGIRGMPTTSNLGYLMRQAVSLSAFLTCTIFAFWLLACWETLAGDPKVTTSEAVVTEGNSEVLHLYTALDTNEAKIYIRAFEEESGIQVRWVRLSAGEVLVRIRSERTNPQVTLWFGGPSPEFIVAKNEGLLAPYAPRVDFEPPSGTFDKAHYWTGFYFGAIGFASNTEILARKEIIPPTSWYDLLKPKLKGEISMAYAYTSGTANTLLAAIVQMMGEDAGFDYIAKLDQNVHHYNRSGSACVTQVGFGEVAVGIAFSHDIVKKGPAKGYPVVLSFPKEGTGFEIGAMALVKGGPNQVAAKQFMDWALSVQAQNLMQKWFRTPLNPKAKVAPGAVTADKVKLIQFDPIWAANHRQRLVERWREITTQ